MTMRLIWTSIYIVAWGSLFISGAEATVSGTSGAGCSVSQAYQPGQPLPASPPNASATLADARALAWRYAPVVHFHPLEPYYLQSISTWWNSTTLFLTDLRPAGQSAYDFALQNDVTSMLFNPRSFVTALTPNLTAAQRGALLAGAPFDARNDSTATVAYTVVDFGDANEFWSYTFTLFYPWNGCSNQVVALSLEGANEVTNYLMCPVGVHEGDLEHVSVLVSKATRKALRVAYSQHTWLEVRDCEAGQCPFDPDTGNPVTFAALESHANYPTASPLNVYQYETATVDGVALANVGGVYIGDRSLADPFKRWVPAPEKLVYVPPAVEIVNKNLTEFNWAIYPGNWGAQLQMPPITFECINKAQTEKFECPANDTAIRAMKLLLKVDGSQDLGVDYQVASPNNNSVGYPGISGPLLRASAYTWLGLESNESAPIHAGSVTNLTCPYDLPTLHEADYDTGTADIGSSTTSSIINCLVGICLGSLLFSLLLVILLTLPVIMSKTAGIRQLAARQMSRVRVELLDNAVVDGLKAAAAAIPARSGASAVADMAEVGELPGSDAAANAGAHAAGAKAGGGTEGLGSQVEVLQLQPVGEGVLHRSYVLVWAGLAGSLFIAGAVLAVIGVGQIFASGVASQVEAFLGLASVTEVLNTILIAALVLIGILDALVIITLFFTSSKTITIRRWKIRNYLGGRVWLTKRAFGLSVACVGFVTIVICIASVLFALGLSIFLAQLGVRVACNAAFNAAVLGQSVQSICIDVPTQGGSSRICGYQVLQTCVLAATSQSWFIMLGSNMLLWSHLIWLVMLIASVEAQRERQAVLRRGASWGEEGEEEGPGAGSEAVIASGDASQGALPAAGAADEVVRLSP